MTFILQVRKRRAPWRLTGRKWQSQRLEPRSPGSQPLFFPGCHVLGSRLVQFPSERELGLWKLHSLYPHYLSTQLENPQLKQCVEYLGLYTGLEAFSCCNPVFFPTSQIVQGASVKSARLGTGDDKECY